MKPTGFKIKVSDLLLRPGSFDTIKLENKHSEQLNGLDENGISATIELTALDKESVQTRITDLKAGINDTCDICGGPFVRMVNVEDFDAKFYIPSENHRINSEEDFFEINPKDESIDIEDMIVQSIKLQEPITKICPICLEKRGNDDIEDDYYDNFEDNMLSTNTIIIK